MRDILVSIKFSPSHSHDIGLLVAASGIRAIVHNSFRPFSCKNSNNIIKTSANTNMSEATASHRYRHKHAHLNHASRNPKVDSNRGVFGA
jgi:hypothetical protein